MSNNGKKYDLLQCNYHGGHSSTLSLTTYRLHYHVIDNVRYAKDKNKLWSNKKTIRYYNAIKYNIKFSIFIEK